MAGGPDRKLIAALGRVPLLSQCSKAELRTVALNGKQLRKKAGAEIVTEGTGGIAFFLITEGTVDIVRGGQTVVRLLPGDFFGEMAMLLDEPRNASAVAASDVELFTFTQWAFKSVLMSSPKMMYGVLQTVAARNVS